MARKSRKNMMPQAAVQEAVQQNEKELLRTAAYARLSVENGGHETEDSLHTQILQIHNYIRENPELTLTDTYADNGFTGTRFDRPEFERMMQDVRTGKIQCIVVKDLSRFGRDYPPRRKKCREICGRGHCSEQRRAGLFQGDLWKRNSLYP